MRLTLLILSAGLVLGSGALQAQQPTGLAAQQRTEADLAALAAGAGAQAARNESTTPWIWGGFAGGLTTGPIGTGLAWFLADNSQARLEVPRAMMISTESGPVYLQVYEEAFAETLRARRKRSALVGGAFGTATLGAVLFAIWADYYYNNP